ncbi:MAG: glutaredoxin 3 [Hyphomicrobiales bacterium]|nr:glutaredoxin 3 [Hyphomicrobiales bacterium]MDE2113541.1 glutaredoxin 3 [Hyphomicrobiales bacterium]
MRNVTIYTKSYCPYCQAALDLLKKKGVNMNEISVDGDREGQRAMAQRAGGRSTVPQIFVGDQHIGGCDDMYALDNAGKLDAILTQP